ncbi:aldehyde dehydrogenase family protein [Nocardioides sp. Kera G14]|uniref:aldehyde dehydrogenase family protein n=1 Tax=Nocardioides sp. Kera G14 TaxID=2884264 RepID=UPI001D0FA8AB|nr:aldehyde dehydrogenase family protein [Nocardioides sp. Kera G14]UDY24652.1 aldehyde dehydrogenase family protein [Nocardioides sp. Kera G14]
MTTTPEIGFATTAELDQAVTELTAGAAGWARMDLRARIDLLQRTHAAVAQVAEAWARDAIAAKGITSEQLEGEEWLTGPYGTMMWLLAAVESLQKIAQGKSPLDGVKASRTANRTTFRVLPTNLYEFNIYNGFTGELWMRPGVTAEQARANAGLGAVRPGENGGVGLVLGAGNVSSIGPLDVLYELVAYNRASVLKLNPTFGSLKSTYEAAFAPLVRAGLVRIVNGGAEEGAYLTRHEGIGHVHITGSGVTHDMIVWGSLTDRSERRLDKEITSELGGVSPIIVIPGDWSAEDLRFQAENVVTQRLNNAGHNCIAGQALILSSDWAQKDAFLAELRDVLSTTEARAAWYPGSDRKLALAQDSYPEAESLNGRLLIRIDETTSQDLLTTEYFAPVLGHTEVPGLGGDFFANAVAFANDRLDGTLGASIIVAPADRKAISNFDAILADLRYGTIGINVWSAIGFLLPAAAWGAFPGNTIEKVGSGIGIVHNSFLAADVERTVIRGPFRPFPRSVLHGEVSLFPTPPWYVTGRTGTGTAKALTDFAAKPSWARLPKVLLRAFGR